MTKKNEKLTIKKKHIIRTQEVKWKWKWGPSGKLLKIELYDNEIKKHFTIKEVSRRKEKMLRILELIFYWLKGRIMNEICNDLIENTHIDEINELTVKLKTSRYFIVLNCCRFKMHRTIIHNYLTQLYNENGYQMLMTKFYNHNES